MFCCRCRGLKRNGRACVITADNVPTVAGILALGLYPQQFFPRFVIQAAAEPLQGTPAGARARNQAKIAGPIPHMLDQAMEWARRTFDTFIVTEADGNRQLVEICQHVHSAATGARAVEALATGIPLVTEAVREAGLPPARYFDSGIRFTALLRQQSPPAPPTAVPVLSGRDQLIYDLLASAPCTASELADQTQLSADTVRRSLRALRDQGLVRQHGGRGRKTTYQRA